MENKKKKKPIGYTAAQRSSMKALIERTEPMSGDYVGGGTVTIMPKKKKMKRMQMGGMAVGRPVRAPQATMRPAQMGMPVAPGLPPGLANRAVLPPGLSRMSQLPPGLMRPENRTMKGGGLAKKGVGMALKGGGLARKGVGMALAKGGIVNAPARSYKDMRAGAGSGVGRVQKSKIAGRGR